MTEMPRRLSVLSPISISRRGRIDRWDGLFLVSLVAALTILTWSGRALDFWHDDWRVITTQAEWSLAALVEPFNGHWSLLPNAIWGLLLSTIGLHQYWPYLAVVHVAHLATTAAVYWGTRRIAGPPAGLASALIVLVLGANAAILFQGRAIDLVLATALGSWALVLSISAKGDRSSAIAILLVLAIMSNTVGLGSVSAVGAYLLFARARWRELWVVAPALLSWGTWYLLWGSGGGDSVRVMVHFAWFQDILAGVRDGLAYAMGQVTGLGPELGLILITVLFVATAWQLLGSRPPLYPALAGLIGAAVLYLLVALAGTAHEGRSPLAPRYVYPVAPFLVVALVAWYASRPRPRPLDALPVLALVTWSLVVNGLTTRWYIDEWHPARHQETRAALTVLLQDGGKPPLEGDLPRAPSSDPFLRVLPGPDLLRMRFEQLGSPLDASDLPGTDRLPLEVLARVRADILAAAAEEARSMPGEDEAEVSGASD